MPDPLDYATPQPRKRRTWLIVFLLAICLIAMAVLLIGAVHTPDAGVT
jgi:hypothetical protein